jgi:Tfp pilus assembly protein PilF
MRQYSLVSSTAFSVVALFVVSGCTGLSLSRTPAGAAPVRTVSESRPTLLARADDRNKARACLAAAVELVRKGHEEGAIDQLERARSFDSNLDGVSHKLAVLYDRQGNFSKAETEYRNALDEAPRDPDVLSDRGYFLYQRGDLAGAADSLRLATKHAPKHATAWTNLALVQAEQRAYEHARKSFIHAVGEAGAHANLGLIYARHGDHESARKELQSALRLDPGLTSAGEALALLENGSADRGSLVSTCKLDQDRPGVQRVSADQR